MDLSNRDIAFLIWLGAAAVALVLWSPGRQAILSILGLLRGKLLGIALTYTAYFAVIVLAAQWAGIWNSGLLKDTIAWYVLAGLALLFKFPNTYKDPGFYRRALRRLVQVSVAVEFFVGLTSFSFGAELVLLPSIVLLALLSAAASTKPEPRKAKSIFDGLLGLLGLAVIAGTAITLINAWAAADKAELGLLFLLPIWATIFSLPFVFVLGLYANYEPKIDEINRTAAQDRRARWRAKAVLIGSFGMRNRELGKFAPFDARELAQTTSWGEARRLVAFKRAGIRFQHAKEDLAAKKLIRYAGVEGTDWRGQPLDQREFDETRKALDRLAMFQRSQYEQHSRYNPDLAVGILVAERLPLEHGIEMKVNKKGAAWFAWRRTVTGWCLGIGASGPPPDQWTLEGPEPPGGFPKKDGGWRRGEFDDETDD